MKTKYYLLLLTLLVFSLSAAAQRGKEKEKEKVKVVADSIIADTTEYDLVVLDPGFDAWYMTQQHNAHSDEYYRIKNRIYSDEWNRRFMSPLTYGDIYGSYIDYRPEINYGFDFNCRLYFYFKYFEEVNGVSLMPGGGGH